MLGRKLYEKKLLGKPIRRKENIIKVVLKVTQNPVQLGNGANTA